MDDYLDTLGAVGINANLFLIDNLSCNEKVDPKEVKIALQTLRREYEAKYLLFLGGQDVIPFYHVPVYHVPDKTADNVVDPYILSDTYYVDFEEDEFEHWPEMAVGRFPSSGTTSNLLVEQLRRATAMHREGGIRLPEHRIGFSAEKWKTPSRYVYFVLDRSGETLKLCPPVGCKTNLLAEVTEIINSEYLLPSQLLFFNVHGKRTKPVWRGEHHLLRIYPELVNYELFSQADLTNSIILSEACYAAITHRCTTADNSEACYRATSYSCTTTDSLALCALERGALGFFGCTVKCYATIQGEGKPSGVSGIDALFRTLIYYLVVKRLRFGDALSEAKQQHSAIQNDYDEKNVLSLVLLGDPMLCFR